MERLAVAEQPVRRVVVGQTDELGLLHVAAPGADASAWASILTVKTLTVGGATAKVGASAQIRYPRHIETSTGVA